MHGVRLGIGRVAKGFETVGKYVAGDYFQFQKLKKSSTAAFDTVKTVAANAATKVRSALGSIASASKKAFSAVSSASKKAFDAVSSASKKAFDAVSSASKKAFDAAKTGATTAGTAIKNMGTSIKNSTVVTKLAGAATKVWSGIQAAFNAVMAMNPIILIAIAVAALIAVFVLLYFKVEGFREVVDAVFGFVLDVIKGVWNWISENWKLLLIMLTGPFGLAVGLIMLAWDGIKTAISFVWNNVIKPVFQAFGTVFSGVWGGIKSAFKAVWDYIIGAVAAAKSIFGGVGSSIKDAFKAAFNFVADAWNGTLGKIGFTAPKWLGGWSFKIPTIPRLAEGGIVMPSTGGTLARIGEAGRPERVEPLDPDGLSKRDKAMIKMMTGGAAGGVTINVHPSPGMNEVELASLVSRQLAFQLRAGSV
jgi:phage-related protein